MKKWICDACGKETEVYDEYEPEICCNGYGCGCMGKPINPVFCDECEDKFYKSSTLDDDIKPQD